MSSPKVLIIGCGVAGPVTALLLKKKGYEPIVLEKVRKLGDIGGSLMMQPNGLKVLALLGLADIFTSKSRLLEELRDQRYTGEDLGVSHLPSRYKEKYGQPGCGVQRTTLNLTLKDIIIQEKIEIHEGWKLKEIIETEDSVVAIDENGDRMEGSFLIGCDGIKSVTRSLIMSQHGLFQGDAEFTGLTQTGGMSPTPQSLLSRPGMLNMYGPGAHLICYPISPTVTAWAFTQKDPNAARESWKSFTDSEAVAHRKQLLEEFKNWGSPAAELIQGAERLIKFGLYDRPHLEPEQWYSPKFARCVLIGDAAHPTSPHLGQGANQALEDCYHLSRLLPDFDAAKKLDASERRQVFSTFAQLRQPRTSALVRGARAQGEDRVVDSGPEASDARDERLRRKWQNEEALEAAFDALLKEPF